MAQAVTVLGGDTIVADNVASQALGSGPGVLKNAGWLTASAWPGSLARPPPPVTTLPGGQTAIAWNESEVTTTTWYPLTPFSPRGPGGPAGPVGPAGPRSPCGPAGPWSPCGPAGSTTAPPSRTDRSFLLPCR